MTSSSASHSTSVPSSASTARISSCSDGRCGDCSAATATHRFDCSCWDGLHDRQRVGRRAEQLCDAPRIRQPSCWRFHAMGIFKDVRFYPILNFGLFWAPLFSRCFYPIMNFGHFWASPFFKMSGFYPTRNFCQFWADPHFFSR